MANRVRSDLCVKRTFDSMISPNGEKALSSASLSVAQASPPTKQRNHSPIISSFLKKSKHRRSSVQRNLSLIMKQPEASAPLAYANPGTVAYAHPATAIISPHFCSPHPVDIAIVRKVLTITDGNFVVTDINGNIIFKVKGAHLSLHDRRVLLDTAGYPIITLRKKLMSAHERWQVFRGDSTESRDLIFSAKKSSMFQLKTKMDVFLANNITENAPDFTVEGSWFERSCVIYAGDSSTVVAQMHKKHTVKSVLFGKDNFTVTVYPGIDYAFIVALVVILDEINTADSSN